MLAVGSALLLFHEIDDTPFMGDESGWISAGIYYTNLLVEGDFSRDKWDCSPACEAFGALNPHVGKWLLGLMYLPCLGDEQCAFNRYYVWEATLEDNERRGNVPAESILVRGRLSAATAGVLSVLIIFLIGYQTSRFKILTGLFAAGLVVSNVLFVVSTTRAMTDAHYNFFLLASCLSCIAILKLRDQKSLPKLALLSGVRIPDQRDR